MHLGMVKLEIERDKKGFNVMQPCYRLYLEINEKNKFCILFAKKKLFARSVNYIIC